MTTEGTTASHQTQGKRGELISLGGQADEAHEVVRRSKGECT